MQRRSTFYTLVSVGLISALLLVMLSMPIQSTQAQGGTQEATLPAMPPLPGTLVVGELQSPRGIAFDANGTLYVAVAGNGGNATFEFPSIEDPNQKAPVQAGLSGKILTIGSDGTVSTLLDGLPSYATPNEAVGVYRVIPHGDSLWLVVSKSGGNTFWTDVVVELDAKTLTTKNVISLQGYELANNPDGNELDSNVSDIAWQADGSMLIVDTGANTLFKWTAAEGLSQVAVWKGNDVPTSVEVAANGDIYVGFLGAGLAPGAGKVERWSGGQLAETFGGLNAVSDILLDGDTLYAVELVVMGAQGPGPGRVLKVSAAGSTPVAEGLIAPFGIAKGTDGAIYVSFGTVAFAPGMTGGVLKLNPM